MEEGKIYTLFSQLQCIFLPKIHCFRGGAAPVWGPQHCSLIHGLVSCTSQRPLAQPRCSAWGVGLWNDVFRKLQRCASKSQRVRDRVWSSPLLAPTVYHDSGSLVRNCLTSKQTPSSCSSPGGEAWNGVPLPSGLLAEGSKALQLVCTSAACRRPCSFPAGG